MFYCNGCAKKNGWPLSSVKSRGKCECCGTLTVCNDTPSELLPLSNERAREIEKALLTHSQDEVLKMCGKKGVI